MKAPVFFSRRLSGTALRRRWRRPVRAAGLGRLWPAAALAAESTYLFRHCLTFLGPCATAAPPVTPPPVTPTGPEGTRLFFTAATYTGNLGGLAGADAKCMADASKPNDGRTYVALLSTTGVDAKSRFAVTYPVRRADDPSVIIDAASLWDGSVQTAPAATTVTPGTWTGTGADGLRKPETCNSWTSASSGATGGTGAVHVTFSFWAYTGASSCNASMRLYCVSTAP